MPVFFVVVLRSFKVKPVTMKVDETPADTPYASVDMSRHRSTHRRCRVGRAVLDLGACTMAPRYQRPAAPVPAVYEHSETAAQPVAAIPAADIGWRDFFPDAELQDLIGARSPTIATCASPR